jgi:hypothetical protein
LCVILLGCACPQLFAALFLKMLNEDG